MVRDRVVEGLLGEPQRVAAAGVSGVCGASLRGIGEGCGRGSIEEDAGLVFEDRVECAAGAQGDDRAPAGLGFDRGNPEVFDLGKKHEPGAAVEISQGFTLDAPEELDPGRARSVPAEGAELRTIASDD